MPQPTTPLYRTLTAVPCANCQAQPGDPCTQPTDTGRRPVNWVHNARQDEAAAEHAAATPVCPAPAHTPADKEVMTALRDADDYQGMVDFHTNRHGAHVIDVERSRFIAAGRVTQGLIYRLTCGHSVGIELAVIQARHG